MSKSGIPSQRHTREFKVFAELVRNYWRNVRGIPCGKCLEFRRTAPTPDEGFKLLNAVCGVCGDKLEGVGGAPHDCVVAAKLDLLELELVGALMHMEFCDHFCCGLPPRACRAKALAYWIREWSERLTEVLK